MSNTIAAGAGPPINLQYGIYVDGQNNLGNVEDATIQQAIAATKADPGIAMSVEVTAMDPQRPDITPKTYNYTIANGQIGNVISGPERDMSQRSELADDVFWLLQNSHLTKAKQTWLELVDHGAGDAGGLFTVEPNGDTSHMDEDTVAAAVADGEAEYAKAYPNDPRMITGIVEHECFEGTLGVEDSLGEVAGVHYLAAPQETTIAPGVPATVALDIDNDMKDPKQMGRDVVKRVMSTRYDQDGLVYGPAACFGVYDISTPKVTAMKMSEVALNSEIIGDVRKNPKLRSIILSDGAAVPGMQRDDPTAIVPWRADRPAIELDEAWANDKRLPHNLRAAASADAKNVAATIIAHGETNNAIGFGADYRDAVGPTRHFPTEFDEIDPLSPKIAETPAEFNYDSGVNAVTEELLLNGNAKAAN